MSCVCNISSNVLEPSFFNLCNLPFPSFPNIGEIRVNVGPKTNYFSYFMNTCANRIAISYICFHWYVSNQEINKIAPAISFFSYIFWIIYFQLFSCKIYFQESSNYCHKIMNNSLLDKMRARFVQQSVSNVCAKFKVNPLSRFRNGARQMFAT